MYLPHSPDLTPIQFYFLMVLWVFRFAKTKPICPSVLVTTCARLHNSLVVKVWLCRVALPNTSSLSPLFFFKENVVAFQLYAHPLKFSSSNDGKGKSHKCGWIGYIIIYARICISIRGWGVVSMLLYHIGENTLSRSWIIDVL